MKRSVTLLAALVPIVILSCEKEKIPVEIPDDRLEFTATTMQTKTSLDGNTVLWNPGDLIAVSGSEEGFTTTITEPSAEAKFKGKTEPIDGKYYAAYPFSAVQQWRTPKIPELLLPSEQKAMKGTFDNGLNLTVASTDENEMTLKFKNLLSYLSFTVEDSDVVSVKIVSADTPMAGNFMVDTETGETAKLLTPINEVILKDTEARLEPGKYYIALFPGTYPTGFSFEFRDSKGQRAEVSFPASKTFEAGGIYHIGEAGDLTWEAPRLISFEDLRAKAEAEPVVLGADAGIKGIIVSNPDSGNQGENVRTDATHIDYTGTKRTAYIESPDGKFGFMLKSDDKALPITLASGTEVLLNTEGMTLTREENPTRYILSGYTSASVIRTRPAEIPVKEKFINELTDEDVYTFVTLKDVEYPIRKGSLTPVDDAYNILSKINRENQYPSLLRDINGNSIYMYTNTTCPYRRTGKMLNYYRGTVSGVIVNEPCTSMEYGASAPTLDFGTLGRYQIRHQRESDIALTDNYENNFSAILTEFRYLPGGKATYEMQQTFGSPAILYQSAKYKVEGNDDFSYLGPCGEGTKDENGCGIILEDGTDYLKGATKINTFDGVKDGRGRAHYSLGLAWSSKGWYYANKLQGWVIKFSTKDISTNQLSLQLSQMSNKSFNPIYWTAEWSETENMDDANWKKIGDYYIPGILQWSTTQLWHATGYKMINIPLPLEMLGKENVYIRLHVTKNVTNNDTVFEGGTINNSQYSALSYVGIRYNK